MPDKKAVHSELYFWGELKKYSGVFFLDFYVELAHIHLSWSFKKNSIILMKFDYCKENTGNSLHLQDKNLSSPSSLVIRPFVIQDYILDLLFSNFFFSAQVLVYIYN